jgi:predicted MFS family arabinose efflux permease
MRFPPLLALAIGAFGIGVTEFAPMGMLPAIAADLHVSIPSTGLPLASWVGETIGWRSAFGGIAALGALTMVSLRLALPPLHAAQGGNMMAEVRVLCRPPVLGALALTVLGSSAMFTVFTSIAAILREEMHASTAFVTAMLVLFGILSVPTQTMPSPATLEAARLID